MHEDAQPAPAPRASEIDPEVLEQALDASRDVICLIEAETALCLYTSPSCESLIGYPPTELIGRSGLEHVHLDDLPAVQEAMVRLVKTAEPLVLRFRMVHRSGHDVWVEASAQPPLDGRNHFGVGLRDITERRELEELLRVAALMDPVTGLANRRLLDDELDAAVARAQRANGSLAAVLLDLDDFKTINDVHGHTAGDAVLREVGRRLCAASRGGDLVARFGGDEFVVLLQDVDSAEAAAVTQRLQEAFAPPVDTGAGPVLTSASLGIAHWHDGMRAADLLAEADRAMYAVKHERVTSSPPDARPAQGR